MTAGSVAGTLIGGAILDVVPIIVLIPLLALLLRLWAVSLATHLIRAEPHRKTRSSPAVVN